MSSVSAIEAVRLDAVKSPMSEQGTSVASGLNTLSAQSQERATALAQPQPTDGFSATMVEGIKDGLRNGFVHKQQAEVNRVFGQALDPTNNVSVTQLMLVSYKFQSASALATAVQTMSTNVKQSIDKLITAA